MAEVLPLLSVGYLLCFYANSRNECRINAGCQPSKAPTARLLATLNAHIKDADICRNVQKTETFPMLNVKIRLTFLVMETELKCV